MVTLFFFCFANTNNSVLFSVVTAAEAHGYCGLGIKLSVGEFLCSDTGDLDRGTGSDAL